MNHDSPSPVPTRCRVGDLAVEQAGAVCALYDRIWPPTGRSLAERSEQMRADWAAEARELFGIWDGTVPLALAMLFPRTVQTDAGPLTVAALAGVCSAPERRGQGLGAAVVRAAFAQVDAGRFGVALFQTPVAAFYARLGARPVHNGFVNPRHRPGDRGSPDHPWWDDSVMIYPAAFPWPDGRIDLGGPGY